MFSVSGTGDVTPVASSMVLGSSSSAVAFSPLGGLLAATSEQPLGFSQLPVVVQGLGERRADLGRRARALGYDPFAAVAFSPDGTLVATANQSESTVSVHPLAPPLLDTAITSGPPAMTSATNASFGFEANYPSTLECRLDTGAFVPCATELSHAYAGLDEGAHTFAVRATDLLGDVEPLPASRSWTVDLTAPVVASLAQPASGACEPARLAAVRVVADDRQPDRR